jgi:hypothetical protein
MQLDNTFEDTSVNPDINPPYDPFDMDNLRIDQSHLSQPAAKKLLVTVPVRKPHRQDFVRVHPAPEYRLNTALIELHDEREVYLVPKPLVPELGEAEFFAATLYLCINRQKVVSVWPVKLPTPDGRKQAWHLSAAEAAERAMTTWIKLAADMSLGAYQIFEALSVFGEPEWPSLSFSEILRIAFKGRIVDTPEHLVIQRLRGLV